MQGVDLALIMHKLNHESIAYPKRYLGIIQEYIDKVKAYYETEAYKKIITKTKRVG